VMDRRAVGAAAPPCGPPVGPWQYVETRPRAIVPTSAATG
jgi:hypothetical protein